MLAAMRTTGEMRHVLFGDVLKFLFELLAFGRPAVAALHFFFETLLDFLDHVLQFHLARLHSSKVLQGMREREMAKRSSSRTYLVGFHQGFVQVNEPFIDHIAFLLHHLQLLLGLLDL